MAIVPPSDTFLPFALPDIGEEEIEAVVESLRSGWVTERDPVPPPSSGNSPSASATECTRWP